MFGTGEEEETVAKEGGGRWVHPILQRKKALDVCDNISQTLSEYRPRVWELELERDVTLPYKNYLRVTPGQFMELARLVGPYIQKLNTNWRSVISLEERLAVTLRYLSTGDSLGVFPLLTESGVVQRVALPQIHAKESGRHSDRRTCKYHLQTTLSK